MRRALLVDGTSRFESGAAAFDLRRVGPGVVLLNVRGHDVGDIGDEVVNELAAEQARFRRPLALFVDAAEVGRIAPAAQSAWTRWLADHRADVSVIHAFAPTPTVALAMEVACHFARVSDKLVLHASRAALAAAVGRATPERRGPASAKSPAEAAVSSLGDGERLSVITDGACTFRFASESDAVILAIEGFDRGTLGSRVFDVLAAHFAGGPRRLVLDLRHAKQPAGEVVELWTAWMRAHRDAIRGVDVVLGSASIAVAVSIASWRAGLGSRVRMTRSG